jgi:hypothetical protein
MRRFIALVVVALLAGSLGPVGMERPEAEATVSGSSRANVNAYRGLGSWVDIYDTAELSRPVATIKAMAARGVRTLYLETSNYRSARAILYPRATERFIHAAHARGMKVVAWYLPGFQNLKRDRKRSMAAIRYRTSQGHRFDSFALDIEASVVRDPRVRTRRLLRLSRFIRKKTGRSYPLGAIIPAPRGMQLTPSYWPGFPYKELSNIYDVFVPMGYFTYRVSGQEAAHDYTRRNIVILRNKTGKPRVPIHVIGGISDDATRAEVRGYVRALREHGALGGSLYAFDHTTDGHWLELVRIPTNPRQRPALPVRLGYTEPLGNIPGGDRTHPKEVFFRTGGRTSPHTLGFRAFDVSPGEVEVYVNWRKVGDVDPTPAEDWGDTQVIEVPAARLKPTGPNYVHFQAVGDFPGWSVWGVRDVSLTAP